MLINSSKRNFFKYGEVYKFEKEAVNWFRLYQSVNKKDVWPHYDFLENKLFKVVQVEKTKSNNGHIIWLQCLDGAYTGMSGFVEEPDIDLWYIDTSGKLSPCPHKIFKKVGE